MLRLALYQPDIPQNAGTLLRLGACLGVGVDIIEPCGFALTDKGLRRAGLDYLGAAEMIRHADWAAFLKEAAGRRLVLLTTKGATPYWEHAFGPGDTLIVGRESAGVPDEVHGAAAARLLIPMRGGARSINVATAAAMVLGEGLRQIDAFPDPTKR